MSEYRRQRSPGAAVFLTWVTHNRRPIFRAEQNVDQLRAAIAEVKRMLPFEVLAAAILHDHVHYVWELPLHDGDYSKRVGMIKARFSRVFAASGFVAPGLCESRRRRRERPVWQRRFWEHTIRDERDFETHMDYVHYNPVKHGFATCPHAWPYSSFHRWVRAGHYDPDWGCCCDGRIVRLPTLNNIAGRAGE